MSIRFGANGGRCSVIELLGCEDLDWEVPVWGRLFYPPPFVAALDERLSLSLVVADTVERDCPA